MLLALPNLKYNEIINKYNHLGDIQMHDTDTKNLLPIHITLRDGVIWQNQKCDHVLG